MPDVGKVNTKALDDIGKINLMDVPVAGVLAEDVKGAGEISGGAETGDFGLDHMNILSGANYNIISVTPTFADCKGVIGFGTEGLRAVNTDSLKARLLVGGVQQAESGYLPVGGGAYDPEQLLVCMDVNGLTTLIAQIHNYHGSERRLHWVGLSLLYGSIKVA